MKLTTLLLLISLGGYGQFIELPNIGNYGQYKDSVLNYDINIPLSVNPVPSFVGVDDGQTTIGSMAPKKCVNLYSEEYRPVNILIGIITRDTLKTGGSTSYTPDWIFHGPLDDCNYNLCEHERIIRDLERRVKELEDKLK